ncbi:ester cyclase [Flaviflagellibacter deserti]|uniref:Ester cyclase n=1 Tax=Flaviflagellibacter deserti TaxID=2267266 RepID=A0ABV9Z386_9HYPH
MNTRNSIEIVRNFWREVWQAPQNPHAIDLLVAEDMVISSAGIDITGRDAFKKWVIDFQSKMLDADFKAVEMFQSADGSRVVTRWRLTGRNNGILGTEPCGSPIEMIGTAIWAVRQDGLLQHNWVERNALEIYRELTPAKPAGEEQRGNL